MKVPVNSVSTGTNLKASVYSKSAGLRPLGVRFPLPAPNLILVASLQTAGEVLTTNIHRVPVAADSARGQPLP